MIKIENTDVYGFEAAIRGMRNPKNSWEKSDSIDYGWGFVVGQNDIELMKSLSKAGTDHSKYLRFITITADITAPLYWWKEYDTYKVGTVANSCSTMHKIHEKEFTIDDFSHEHLLTHAESYNGYVSTSVLECVIGALNEFRKLYLDTKNKAYWWQMIQLLPSSYNQTRTVTMTYENIYTMRQQRKGHKLDEWRIDFFNWSDELPHLKELFD